MQVRWHDMKIVSSCQFLLLSKGKFFNVVPHLSYFLVMENAGSG